MVYSLHIAPYTPFVPAAIEEVDEDEVHEDAAFSILLANVFMKNRTVQPLLNTIGKMDPTFVLTMEVNDWWVNQLSSLEKKYPYRMSMPTSNSYGMTLYSKLPLQATETRFLNHDSVPSFYATVTLPDGDQFRLICIHPVAPKPSEHPDNKNQKEVALIKAAKIVEMGTLPTVVAGDFNDVGWSHNTKRFATISHLNDVRYGRGFYPTFDATSIFMRWPLDYVYASDEFRVVELERLDDVGSDHFPYYVKLALQPEASRHSD